MSHHTIGIKLRGKGERALVSSFTLTSLLFAASSICVLNRSLMLFNSGLHWSIIDRLQICFILSLKYLVLNVYNCPSYWHEIVTVNMQISKLYFKAKFNRIYFCEGNVRLFNLFLLPFVKRPLVWLNRKCRHTLDGEGRGIGLESEEGFPASTAQLCCYGRCCRPPAVPCHHVHRGTERVDDIKPMKPEPRSNVAGRTGLKSPAGTGVTDWGGRRQRKMRGCECGTGTGCHGASTSQTAASLWLSAWLLHLASPSGGALFELLWMKRIQAGVWHPPWADAFSRVRRMTAENETFAASIALLAG